MKRLRFFTWIAFPLGLYLAYAQIGLPHLRWSYSWVDGGQGFDPLAARYYTRCTFWGPYGRFTLHHPPRGKCAWVIFKKFSATNQG